MMKAEFVHVSPQQAEAWLLSSNSDNRNLRSRHLDAMRHDMLKGRWVTSPAPLVFGADGRLYDGHHRLTAQVKAGVSLTHLLVTGAGPEVLKVIDIGLPRTVADLLKMEHAIYDKDIAAMARVLIQYDDYPYLTWGSSVAMSKPEVLEYAIDNLDRLETAAKVARVVTSDRNISMSRPVVGAVHFIVSRDSYQPLSVQNEFFDGWATGANLSPGDPRLALRRQNLRLLPPHWRQQAGVALGLKAWNRYAKGQTVQLLRFSKNELPMPKAR